MKNAAIPAASTAEPDRRLRTEMFLANQATAIVAGSAAEATALVDLARAPIDRVWVVPPGVDLDLFAPQRAASASTRIRAELGIDADIPLIAVVGRIQPLKDQELAIRALALAKPGPVMVIAGEPTPGDDAYLRSLRGLGGDVRFVGALTREGIADLLAAASLTILPSRSETFGIVALESAASGTPVLAYRGSGMRESVADGISGELVNSREPADWAASIDRLLGDPRRLDALGVSARHHAEPYTWAAAATSLLALYESFRE
jgi:D-inositol-3-phosphate glycosyltransferase